MSNVNPWEGPQSSAAASPSQLHAQMNAEGRILLLPPGKESNVKVSAIASLMAVTKEQEWLKIIGFTALAIVVAGFIPVVPQLVLLGYLLYLAESRIRRPGEPMLMFEFDYLMKYLMRGVWYFIAQLVISLIVAIPIGFLSFVMFFILGALGLSMGEMGIIVLIGGFFFLWVGMVVVGGLVSLAVTPAIFRAGMAGDFKEAFNFGWVKSFIGNTWKEAILGWILWQLLMFPLAILGLLLCVVGSFAVGAIASIGAMVFIADLYRLHLERGGEPIAMDPKVALENIATK